MKTESRKISGKAYLVGGDEKAVNALIDGILAMTQADKKAEVKKALTALLVKDFTIEAEVEIPETFDEAVEMLPNGMESVTKQTISKAITNQYDKIRVERVKELVKEANVAELLGKVLGK
jgi:hypothetical protein